MLKGDSNGPAQRLLRSSVKPLPLRHGDISEN
jgi:hypothetical protein